MKTDINIYLIQITRPNIDHHRPGAGTWAPLALAILAVQALADARNLLCLEVEHVGDILVACRPRLKAPL